jgi:FkbM family methyltransferase
MDNHGTLVSALFDATDFPADAFRIENALGGRKIIVYGIGECCKWPFYEVVVGIHGFAPSLFLDRSFGPGSTFEGLPGFRPSDYRPTLDEQQNAVVVVCVGSPGAHPEIIRNLGALGFRNILPLQDVYEVHNPFSQPPELEHEGFAYYLRQRQPILDALELFTENESRDVFRRILETHMRRKPMMMASRPTHEQFFPTDVPLTRGYARFVSCGADTGSTIRLLHETRGRVDAVAAIEPDPWLFAALAEYLTAAASDLAGQVVAFPCAAYSRDEVMGFTSANTHRTHKKPTGFASRIKADGERFIQAVTLDHVIPGFDPTHIAMDCEGAEYDALQGAETLIRRCRPDLAVCVYHAPQHLWAIPLYLHSLGLGYRFYLRNYTSFCTETVLYATV